MTGELHASFRFQSPKDAKLAWERVARRCRRISVNRWVVNPFRLDGEQAITVLCEERERATFEHACRLLAAGERFDPEPHVLHALIAKRQELFDEGGGRRVVRNPTGTIVTADGIDLGPLRRPQG